MNKIILGTGGNLGNREANLLQAAKLITQRVGKIIRLSSIYETKPWGISDQPDFLNQVIISETDLSPQQALKTVLEIENDMGRIRLRKWFTRLIDIDILFYENQIIQQTDLIIPHPFVEKRNFVLAPLAEIAPDFRHPVLQKTIQELYQQCPDPLSAFAFEQIDTRTF